MSISFRHDRRPVLRCASGTTVCEEALHDGRWVGLYWSATGHVQVEQETDRLPRLNPVESPLHAFDLEIDGQDLRNRWEFVAASEREGARPATQEAVVELRHQVRPVTLKVVTRLDGTPFLVRYLEITNTGPAPAALSRVNPWAGLLWVVDQPAHWADLPPDQRDPFILGFFNSPGAGSEGNFQWEPLPLGRRTIESTNGESGFGAPFFMVRNQLTGELAVGSLAWSGNWYAEFRRDPYRDRSGRQMNLAFRMGPQGPAPLRVIAPGETVLSPETHLAILHGGLDECVAAWHAHLRTSVVPPRPKGKEFYTVAGHTVSEPGDWTHREIDIAAEMGVGAYMIDAGWYGDEFGGWQERRGDWWVGQWIPGGLAACRERCHKHGMLFGLWMEAEVMGPKSRLLKEHPEWVLRTDNGRDLFPPGEAQVLDLANPEAASFLRESVLRVIREFGLDFFKLDYNKRVQEGGQHERAQFLENVNWRHCETLYAVFDQVRREMPEVALECCSSGGGRNDLGMMTRFHYACESDYSQFPNGIRAINGLTLYLPPEAVCYYHNHIPDAHQKADLDTHLRVTLFAQPIFVGFGAQDADRSTACFEKIRRYIQLAREFTGPILAGRPNVFHHTPDIGLHAPADWCVLEYAARDRSAGYAGVFRIGGAGDREYHFRPRGLDASRTYRVTLDSAGQVFDRAGSDLVLRGIPVFLSAINTSELVMYQAT